MRLYSSLKYVFLTVTLTVLRTRDDFLEFCAECDGLSKAAKAPTTPHPILRMCTVCDQVGNMGPCRTVCLIRSCLAGLVLTGFKVEVQLSWLSRGTLQLCMSAVRW